MDFKEIFTESTKGIGDTKYRKVSKSEMAMINSETTRLEYEIKNDKDYRGTVYCRNVYTYTFATKKKAQYYFDELSQYHTKISIRMYAITIG